MDISEQEKENKKLFTVRMKERGLFWNPTTKERQQKYNAWLTKQADQRQKTLELDGTTHSRIRKEQLRHEKKAFIEEAKRIKDLIKDGK